MDKFTLYKTEETVEYIESTVTIYHSANPILKDHKLPINITSDEAEGLVYTVKIFDSDSNLIYESEYIESGKGVSTIDISKEYEIGSYECFIKCDTYKNNGGSYIGTVESTFEMRVK